MNARTLPALALAFGACAIASSFAPSPFVAPGLVENWSTSDLSPSGVSTTVTVSLAAELLPALSVACAATVVSPSGYSYAGLLPATEPQSEEATPAVGSLALQPIDTVSPT